jgi:hypothetical protein
LAVRASRTTGFSRSVARAIVGNDNCCRQDCFRGAVILAKAGRLGPKQPPGAEGGEIEASNSWLRRFAVLGLGIVGVWFIVFVLRITDRRLPTILALSLTYAIAGYVILPRVARMGLKILQRKSVPRASLACSPRRKTTLATPLALARQAAFCPVSKFGSRDAELRLYQRNRLLERLFLEGDVTFRKRRTQRPELR